MKNRILTVLVTAGTMWNNCTAIHQPHPQPLSFTQTPTGFEVQMEDNSTMIYTRYSNFMIIKWELATAIVTEQELIWGNCNY